MALGHEDPWGKEGLCSLQEGGTQPIVPHQAAMCVRIRGNVPGVGWGRRGDKARDGVTGQGVGALLGFASVPLIMGNLSIPDNMVQLVTLG